MFWKSDPVDTAGDSTKITIPTFAQASVSATTEETESGACPDEPAAPAAMA